MSDKDLIAEARRLENNYGDNYEVMTHMSALADALEAATERFEKAEHDRLYWRGRYQTMHKRAKRGEAERDAALAAIELVADDWASDEDAKGLHFDLRAALDGAPEPEWEYQWGSQGQSFEGFDGFSSYQEARMDMERESEWPDDVVLRRRKAGPWLPVEVKKP